MNKFFFKSILIFLAIFVFSCSNGSDSDKVSQESPSWVIGNFEYNIDEGDVTVKVVVTKTSFKYGEKDNIDSIAENVYNTPKQIDYPEGTPEESKEYTHQYFSVIENTDTVFTLTSIMKKGDTEKDLGPHIQFKKEGNTIKFRMWNGNDENNNTIWSDYYTLIKTN